MRRGSETGFKMESPKIKFTIAKPKEIVPLINHFLNPRPRGWDWSHYILNKYPELKKKLVKATDKKKRNFITKNFFETYYKKEIGNLEKVRKEYQKAWDKINNKIMIALSEIVEYSWPKNCEKITARVSLCPINPRYIKSRTFDINYSASLHSMKAITIHEILHFIYFEKWKRIFPKIPEKKFEAPYLVWDLSELITSIVLSDKRIQNVFKHKPTPYKEHEKMKISGKCVLNYINELYKKRKNFEDFLRKSWRFVKKHKKEIGGKD
jgi:hypothetical protein